MRNNFALYRQLFPLLLLIFLDSFGFFLVIPVLVKIFYHSDFLNAGISQITRNKLTGMTISLPMIAAFFTAPFLGMISDKIGRRKTLLFCVSCISVGFLLPIIGILKKSIALFLIGRVLSGFGSASQPIAQAVVSDVCNEKEMPLFLGSIAFVMTLALILGPLVGGFLSDTALVSFFNNETPFEFSAAFALFNFVLLYFFFKETHTKRSNKMLKHFVRDMIKMPSMIHTAKATGLVFVFFCLELSWSLYYQSISLFLHNHFLFSPEKISLFISTMGVAMIVGLTLINPLLHRFLNVKTILMWAIGLLCLSLLASPWLLAWGMPWLIACCIALSTGITYVSVVALISNKISKQQQGVLMGYLSAFMYFSWFITAIASGFLISIYSRLPMIISAMIVTLGALYLTIFASFSAKKHMNS